MPVDDAQYDSPFPKAGTREETTEEGFSIAIDHKKTLLQCFVGRRSALQRATRIATLMNAWTMESVEKAARSHKKNLPCVEQDTADTLYS